eukprot:7930462-Pyramimonas_sp.AAC.2
MEEASAPHHRTSEGVHCIRYKPTAKLSTSQPILASINVRFEFGGADRSLITLQTLITAGATCRAGAHVEQDIPPLRTLIGVYNNVQKLGSSSRPELLREDSNRINIALIECAPLPLHWLLWYAARLRRGSLSGSDPLGQPGAEDSRLPGVAVGGAPARAATGEGHCGLQGKLLLAARKTLTKRQRIGPVCGP